MEINFRTILRFVSAFRSFRYWNDWAQWRNQTFLAKNFIIEVSGFRVSLLFCHLRERERESLAMEINFWTMLCFVSEIQKCSLLGWSCSMKKWKASPNPVELVFLGYFIVMALRDLTPAKCRLLRPRSEFKHSLHYFFCNRICSS
jgi:hypothetical protein